MLYINCFTKIVVAVGGSNDSLKCWIFKKGLRLNYVFWEKLGRKETHNLKDLLNRVKPYQLRGKNFVDGVNRVLEGA